MYFTMAIILAITSAWLELSLVRRVNFLKEIFSRHPLLPVCFSVGLSMFLGAMFGAAGLVVMMAGIGSTLMTQPYYWFLRNRERLYLSMSQIVVVRHVVPNEYK